MAHHWLDNVHTTALSPRDYQVELLAAAAERNTIVCLDHGHAKQFIALSLILERAAALRSRPADGDPPPTTTTTEQQQQQQHTIVLSDGGRSMYNHIFHLTDLRVAMLNERAEGEETAAANAAGADIDWTAALAAHQVLIVRPALLRRALDAGRIAAPHINLLVIEDCHRSHSADDLAAIVGALHSAGGGTGATRVLGLAGPLHSAACPPGHLGAELRRLQRRLRCRTETASDIVTVLRYCSAPTELLVQCGGEAGAGAEAPPPPPSACALSAVLRELVGCRLAFLREHRFDPSEIYGEEFADEWRALPDPRAEPLELAGEFLLVR